ncbi:hypothetical protein MBLNU230_g5326t1 [Neophaeotheca triangularis]
MSTANTSKPLFTLPIVPDGSETADPAGKIVVSKPASGVYLVEFASGGDNRLTSAFCNTLHLALDIIAHRHPPGVVITTSSIKKFYSNGLDLSHASFTPGFFPSTLYALWKRLLTFPMPTIALMNGHAFAGALMLAMMHDYRVMNPDRGYLCLNELELGVPLRPAMSSVFREKLAPDVYRRCVLEAARFGALDALKSGLVDHLGLLPETLAYIDEMKLVQKAQPSASGKSVYGELKREMYRETVGYLSQWAEEATREEEVRESVGREKRASERRVGEWEGRSGKAKL